MPPVNVYRCPKCGFAFPAGWGGYMYVEDETGERIPCPHPTEWAVVAKILGPHAPEELIAKRVGFNSDCICLDCQRQFPADVGDETANPWRSFYESDRPKDRRECPACKSKNVKTVFESIGQTCPRCKEGTIVELESFFIS